VTCRISPISPATAEPLAFLHRAAFPEEPWDAGALAAILAIPGSFGLIASAGDEPAGFLLARDLGSECEILSLGVLPERRRRGIGGALLQAALDEARQRDLTSAVLEVAADNAAAQAVYTRAGFVRVGYRARYYKRRGGFVNALIMSAHLVAST
jgi:[ribosomal protein S18]-alanine N-acetyltransferase